MARSLRDALTARIGCTLTYHPAVLFLTSCWKQHAHALALRLVRFTFYPIGRWLCASGLALIITGAMPSLAKAGEAAAVFSGKVLDSTSGKYLEGAEIAVQGTEIRVSTGRAGVFVLPELTVGSHTLLVTYLGLEPKTETIQVRPGDKEEHVVRLGAAEVLQLNVIRVSTAREGMAQAIALQKVSVQSKVVAAADQFGEVSEGNVGEYLKFLPGVTIDYNVNDARGISLRGLSTAFTIVAVDGTPMAGTSSMDDSRRFEFEQIAMNNVETTELFKTVTPDLPASSTGGFVNFVTKSAFDSEGVQRFSYNASLSAPSTNLHFDKQGGVWGHKAEYTIRPSLDLNYARRVNSKFGFNLNYRLSEKYDDSPRTTATWNQVSIAGQPSIFSATPRLGTFAVRSEQKLTHREAFATKLDYFISDATKLSVSGQWNWYDLNFTQRGPTFALGTNATANGDSYTSGTGAGVTAPAGTITNGVLYRNKYGTTWHVNGTLSHEFSSKAKASFTTYFSRADGQYRDVTKGFISSAQTMSPSAATYTNVTIAGLQQGDLPTISLTNAGTLVSLDLIRSLSNYTFSNTTGTNFQSRPWSAIDTKKGVSGVYYYDLALAVPVKLQTGFALDDVERYINRPDYRGAIPATTGSALTALSDPNYTKDVAFGFGSYQVVDPYKVKDAFISKLTLVSADDVRNFHEKNNAGYLRADANLTSELLVIGGVRWENHTIDAQAQSRANKRSKLAQINLDYAELYPSLSFKYSPKANRNVVVRGGVSRTVGHPDYVDLLPVITSESAPGAADGVISVPDPKLKPYFSTNFDLSIDYYLKHSGVLSVYGYVKDVKNAFVQRSMTASDIQAVAADYGYNSAEFSSGIVTENGGTSRLSGLEISYAQNLTFLPKPFDGLSIQANFTALAVNTNDLDLRYSQLRAVSPKTANFILNYRYRAFSVTATTNWVSESIFGGFVATAFVTGTKGNALTGAPDTRLVSYRDEKATTDVKFEYAINKNASVYFLVRNIMNSQRIDYYRGYLKENQGVILPFNRYEFGEPHLTLGVRGRF